ncbi:MAG TPA: prealbumin-like fold domain-containing protein [Gaiella sp.]|nr:prealbumin-like fold domain-containing protein [Gaiella sp.]
MARRWLALAIAAMAAVATVLFFVVGASANLSGSTFEGNDGNLVVTTTGNTDWDNAPNLVAQQDLTSGQTDNSFGQGTQENDIAVTVVTGSIPNSKADLARFAVAGETVGANSFLYLAWSRENDSGSVNYDFEINQAAQPNLTTPGSKTLVRTAGDLNISYAFQGNNLTPSLGLRIWNGTSWGAEQPLAGCSEGLGNSGTVLDTLGGLTGVNRTTGRFGEAAINLTCAGIVQAGECEGFSSAYLKSRASQSFTSEVKDFIAPHSLDFASCGAIAITKTTKKPGMTGPQPQANVAFAIDGVAAGTTGTDGTLCVDGLALGNHTVTETVPTGYQADGDNPKTVNVAAVGDCDSGATAVSFSNSPLTDVTISVDSKADGGTATSVDCTGTDLDFTTGTNGDGSDTSDVVAGSKTYTCTITIDP